MVKITSVENKPPQRLGFLKDQIDEPPEDFDTMFDKEIAEMFYGGDDESRQVLALAGLPPLHGDPFDRLLMAQSISEGIVLLTHYKRVAAYSDAIRLV